MPNFTDLELSSAYRSYFGLYIGSVAAANYLNFKDLGFLIKSYQGAGLPQITNTTIPYGTKGWENYQGSTVNPRLYVLVGVIEGNDLKDITQKKQRLISLLAPVSGVAPLVYLAFQLIDKGGASVGKQLTVPVHYVSGLEGSTDNIWDEPIALAFEEHATSQITEATVNTVNAQSLGPLVPGLGSSVSTVWTRANGAWTQPWAGIGTIRAVTYGPDGDLYVGTNGNIYRKSNGAASWHASLLGQVQVIRFGPDGNLYAAGNGNAERFVFASGWQAVGSGTMNEARDMVVIPPPVGSTSTAIMYIVGTFTSIASTPGTVNRIASIGFSGNTLNMGVYSTIGTGFDGPAYTIVYHPNGKLYIGGSFTNLNGTSANNIVEYDPVSGAIAALGSGTDDKVTKINILPDGRLLVTGSFSNAGGKAAFVQAYWDGYVWEAVPGSNPNNGFDSTAGALMIAGIDPITGNYLTTSSGDDSTWNGLDWTWGDISSSLTMVNLVYRPSDGELTVAFGADTGLGSFYLSASVPVTNGSTHDVWPQIKIYGQPNVKSIINYTTGKMLTFKGGARFLGAGAVATLQCGGPSGVSLTSNIYGDITNALAKGSDFTDFNLKPGTNYLGVLYYIQASPDVNNYVQLAWQNQHWSFDAATIGV